LKTVKGEIPSRVRISPPPHKDFFYRWAFKWSLRLPKRSVLPQKNY